MAQNDTSESAADPAVLTDLLRTRLYQLLAEVERRGEFALVATGLTPPLNHLLEAVVREPGITVTDIARRLGKTQQAISQSADRLVRMGHVERRVGSGRTVELHATASGSSLSAAAITLEVGNERAMRKALGPERFDALLLLLRESRDLLHAAS